MQMKRAIITGATGTVGTALIEELTQHQVEVLVLCREKGVLCAGSACRPEK